MKTQTQILKTKAGKVLHTAYPRDSEGNREWNRKRCEKVSGEPLQYEPGPSVEVISL